MLLKIKTTHPEAQVLGYLLHKHPEKHQTFNLSFGKAHVFYPVSNENECEAALLLEVDTVSLSRNRRQNFSDSFKLSHYVNDRPYVASSFMTTAISKVLGSALNGTCKDKPDHVQQPFPLELTIAVVHCKAGEDLIRKYFEPLGYKVELSADQLNPRFPEWGESPYFVLKLKHTITVQEALQHLFVLLPALDNNKHYYVGEFEVEKLIDKAGDWLGNHPHYHSIIKRYLKHKKSYARLAVEKLIDQTSEQEEEKEETVKVEKQLEEKFNVHENRLNEVFQELKASGAKSVLDLGCGSGKLLKLLIPEGQFTRIVGMDISIRSLEIASSRLYLENMTPKKRERIELIHGALTYKDDRFSGFDATAIVEVIEHLDQPRLEAFQKVVFKYAQPNCVVLTTPNREYNALFENFNSPNGFRHPDHRFEWTRAEFENWCHKVGEENNYIVTFKPIAPIDEKLGGLSQMAIFKKI